MVLHLPIWYSRRNETSACAPGVDPETFPPFISFFFVRDLLLPVDGQAHGHNSQMVMDSFLIFGNDRKKNPGDATIGCFPWP
jgi:hypothetical protein